MSRTHHARKPNKRVKYNENNFIPESGVYTRTLCTLKSDLDYQYFFNITKSFFNRIGISVTCDTWYDKEIESTYIKFWVQSKSFNNVLVAEDMIKKFFVSGVSSVSMLY
jgi:hypothetical protein